MFQCTLLVVIKFGETFNFVVHVHVGTSDVSMELFMRRKYKERIAVTVYLDSQERQWVEEQSGGNVSEWCRNKILLDGAEPRRAGGQPRNAATRKIPGETNVPSAEMPTAPTKSRDVCSNERCGHFRFEHPGKYCNHGDCKCGGFK